MNVILLFKRFEMLLVEERYKPPHTSSARKIVESAGRLRLAKEPLDA
ncbi:MAG: hypothetical protein HFE32_02030 [Clostridia bacterium]|nr:hypothetical protein [Clostridia bacterium]MCI9290564.1 hypothetical protein [Clostridia bacterium]